MKTSISYILLILVVGGISLTSCTKSLKDDAKRMQEQLRKLKVENDSLQHEADNLDKSVGLDAPLQIKTTVSDLAGNNTTVESVYRLKPSDFSSNYMLKRNDGSYEICIRRKVDGFSDSDALVYFRYDPSTKSVTDNTLYHVWFDAEENEHAIFFEGAESTPGLTRIFTIDYIDLVTGNITLRVQAEASEKYTNDTNSTFRGKTVSSSFNFKGNLAVYSAM